MSAEESSSPFGVAPLTSGEAESMLRHLAGPGLDILLGAPSRTIAPAAPVPRSEAQVRMDEARYRTLVELLPAITFMALFDGGLQEAYVSPQVETILGYSQKEWLDNPILWYQRLHPEDKERWNIEFARTVSSGEPFRAAYRFLARDGHVVWLHGEVRIARDEFGQPQFLHGIGFDISQQKEAEQRVREYAERLQQTNRELEQFAYVASHDLQEPLRTIASYSQILVGKYQSKLDPQADRYFSQIIKAAKRMKALIQAVLEFSRIGQGDLPFELTDYELVLEEAEANLQAAIAESGALVSHDPLPRLPAVKAYMVVLFQNLISNAIKYRSAAPPRIHVSAAFQKDGTWLFEVRDNGVGVEQKHQEKIFVIFQRLQTQEQQPGTGIGLSVCKKIVDLHGGRIWVESVAGRGSTFKILLPVKPKGAGL